MFGGLVNKNMNRSTYGALTHMTRHSFPFLFLSPSLVHKTLKQEDLQWHKNTHTSTHAHKHPNTLVRVAHKSNFGSICSSLSIIYDCLFICQSPDSWRGLSSEFNSLMPPILLLSFDNTLHHVAPVKDVVFGVWLYNILIWAQQHLSDLMKCHSDTQWKHSLEFLYRTEIDGMRVCSLKACRQGTNKMHSSNWLN